MNSGANSIVKMNLTHSIMSMQIPEVRINRNDTIGKIKVASQARPGAAIRLVLLLDDADSEERRR